MTKREMFEQITPIEYANMLREEAVQKRLKYWTKEGLAIMKELWHKHYTTSAHRYICVCVLTFKEKHTDFHLLDDMLKGAF